MVIPNTKQQPATKQTFKRGECSGKKRQNEEHRQLLRQKKINGGDSDKNKKSKSDHKSVGRVRERGHSGGRKKRFKKMDGNIGRSASRKCSQRSERLSQTGRGGKRQQL